MWHGEVDGWKGDSWEMRMIRDEWKMNVHVLGELFNSARFGAVFGLKFGKSKNALHGDLVFELCTLPTRL